ncbi:D-alanyl-D-alanine carboxypeptidase family protein [Bariatricus sp. SGI.154]|uniref:D-alanyl-D-alanine carboxypeptidase family protein n=1 Tax=Bariatricus sp. SGI.154 TaxID=3420549 RepID=UPI003CFC198A
MKKKILLCSLLICVLLMQFGDVQAEAEEGGDEPEQLYAQSAVLMDADSGRVLFGKEEEIIRPMASTTKIMTCILALENMQEGQVVTASGYAAGQPKVRLGVQDQEEYYLKDLLYSLMLESHNDSAVVIAEGLVGSVEGFADMMNQKAKELGCNNTYFITPNGLDESDDRGVHSTTARDLAAIMRYCITQSPCKEEFLEITRTKTYSFSNVEGSRQFSCNNHNAFLDMMDGALTGKTGFTADAGYCYVGALQRDGRTFIVALLACGWPNNKGYKWVDTRKLMEYGIANYAYRDVWEDVDLPDVNVISGVEENNPYEREIQIPVHVEEKDEIPVLLREDEDVVIKTEVEDSLEAPVKVGEKIGSIRYFLDGKEIAAYDVVTDKKVKQRDMEWCLRWIMKDALL